MASNVYAWPPPTIIPPAVVIGYPETLDLQTTFQRGSDELLLPVWFAVADQGTNKDARDALSAVIASGTTIANVLSTTAAWGASNCGMAHIEPLLVANMPYLAVRFDVDVISNGPVNLSTVMDALAALITGAGL